MKNKLFQLYVHLNTMDRRYIQWAYFVFALSLLIIRGMTDEPSGGTR